MMLRYKNDSDGLLQGGAILPIPFSFVPYSSQLLKEETICY